MNKILQDKKGNAMLVAILIMTVLLLVGLGINRLIVAELRVERTFVAGGQAYFASEGASELGLLDVMTNVAGYSVEDEEGSMSNGVDYEYSIYATSPYWPCAVYGDKVFEEDGDLWRMIEAEESVMIPLFNYTEDGIENLTDYVMDYYLQPESTVYPIEEVLRWKIMGIDDSGYTEAISSYDTVSATGNEWRAYTETAGSYQQIAVSDWGGNLYSWFGDENVSDFLQSHSYNYLVLTNVIEDGDEGDVLYVKLRDAKVDNSDAEFVCEYVEILADGINGDYVQQLDVYVKEGEPMPVFDFVLWERE